MVSSESKGWLATVLLTGILTVTFVGLYYLANVPGSQRISGKEFDYTGRPVQAMTKPDQTILMRDEKYVMGQYTLVYRGIKQNQIVLDLYVMELDPEQPYEKRFRKKDAKKEMPLGKEKFRLVSVTEHHLVLKNLSKK